MAVHSKSLLAPEALVGLSPAEVAKRVAKVHKNAARKARRVKKQEHDSHKFGVYYDAEISGWRYLKPKTTVIKIKSGGDEVDAVERFMNGSRIKYVETDQIFDHNTDMKSLTQAYISATCW